MGCLVGMHQLCMDDEFCTHAGCHRLGKTENIKKANKVNLV